MTIQELEMLSDLIGMDASAKLDRGSLDNAEYDAFSYGTEIVAAARIAELCEASLGHSLACCLHTSYAAPIAATRPLFIAIAHQRCCRCGREVNS